MNIVENHLELFARHDFVRLKKVLECDDEDLKEAQEVIHRCNPHPGAIYATDTAETVIPEIIVSKKENCWVAELNPDAMPKIRVNQLYANILRESGSKAALSVQLREAKWLIRNINQRYETILKTSQAIEERQQNYFSNGATSMRPLVMREIADTLEHNIPCKQPEIHANPAWHFRVEILFWKFGRNGNWWGSVFYSHSGKNQATD